MKKIKIPFQLGFMKHGIITAAVKYGRYNIEKRWV